MDTQRYPTIGGVSAWRIPVAMAVAMLCAIAISELVVACVIAVLSVVAASVDRSTVVEVSSAGLARGFTLRGAFLGPARVLPWQSVAEITTAWRAPRDYSVLETIVSAQDGMIVRFSSKMGLAAYRALIADVVRLAPGAQRTGLTDQVLAERHRPSRRGLRVALAVTFALLLAFLIATGA